MRFSSPWEAGTKGKLFFSDRGKIYEWNSNHRVPRSDLKLLASDFGKDNYDERRTRIDWASQAVLGSDARGPVHIWPMQTGIKPISLPAPKFDRRFIRFHAPEYDENTLSIPYDFAVSPDRHWAVVVYGVGKMRSTRLPSQWDWADTDPLWHIGHIVRFDLKTRQSKSLGIIDASLRLPPAMNFGSKAVQFSPSGRLFIVDYSSTEGGLRIYDSASGKHLALASLPQKTTLADRQPEQIAFSPDEKMLAALTWTQTSPKTSIGWVQIWSAESGERLQEFRTKSSPRVLRWSPDSQKVAVGEGDGHISLWNVAPFVPAKSH